MKGQWISEYTGSNHGVAVIDLDELDDCFEGTAVAWESSPGRPSSLVKFRTPSKANAHVLKDIPVLPINEFGNTLSRDQLLEIQNQHGVVMPATVDIDLQFNGNSLAFKWVSSIGTNGAGIAAAPRSRAGEASDIQPIPVKGWDGFKRYVNNLPPRRYMFRGQQKSCWRLRTSFHREGRTNLQKYEEIDINRDLYKIFSALTSHAFNLSDRTHFAALIHLAQHHGYPTPMLDWTWSPYVAAFFAFKNIGKNQTGRSKVRILKLDAEEWNLLGRADKLFPYPPNVGIIDPLAFGNARAIPQQSISLLSNVDDIEAHIGWHQQHNKKKYLEVFDISIGERNNVMRELALMGITAGALFPGLDGACEGLRERNF